MLITIVSLIIFGLFVAVALGVLAIGVWLVINGD